MDGHGQRDNARHKPDHYKMQAQWWMSQQQMKDNYTMKLISIMAERDSALQELNKALCEKREALGERDKAHLQRDAAIAERSNAVMERDKALAALEAIEYAHGPLALPFDDDSARELNNITDASPISRSPPVASKAGRHGKQPKGANKARPPAAETSPPISPRKRSRKRESASNGVGGDDMKIRNHEWKGQGLGGLNQVAFDDSSMPAPVCSCTGELRQCYKWGSGGWQSACCTTTVSMYPLPMMPNKRHSRLGGRKMSGSAFNKLLSRLAAEGHDLSVPLDLKDCWAKHGTNRYITIK